MVVGNSNIRVSVRWSQPTVFAGEKVECLITFKNVASPQPLPKQNLSQSSTNGLSSTGQRQRKTPPLQTSTAAQARKNVPANKGSPGIRGHRPSHSINVPPSQVLSAPYRETGSGRAPQSQAGNEDRPHRRSVSIISIGLPDTGSEEVGGHLSYNERPRRSSRGHSRAASLQIVPRRLSINGPSSIPGSMSFRSSTQPSPLNHTLSPSELSDQAFGFLPTRGYKQSSGSHTAPSTPSIPSKLPSRRMGSGSLAPNFKFPPGPSNADEYESYKTAKDLASPQGLGISDPYQNTSSFTRDDRPVTLEPALGPARILAAETNGETPRSSAEFNSLSNNSTETLASEYLPQHSNGQTSRSHHARGVSSVVPNFQRQPETLMMGYAQLNGSFTLDGSLINQDIFEEVKKKGILGGQGGGVIGVDRSKRDSGLLRGFGWSNIGESLGGLLGGAELSTIKDMRGVASSKSIPLLSTPQSILFVDLKLSPGESRTYKYSLSLPKGLPPSHRGKSIKIVYNLVIGTQRPGGAREQQIKSVEIPFRVLGSVNNYGELLGHDLMTPYIILRDQAKVEVVGDGSTFGASINLSQAFISPNTSESTLEDFTSYVDDLLQQPSTHGLLSPTEAKRSRRPSSIADIVSAREAIDMAIMRSNLATDAQQSANKFEISRNGQRVAVVMLTRPAYRLGEIIFAAIDFTDAEIPCYALHASLETSEKVDSSLALRSDASIHRVTRKIYSSHSESTLFARRVVFSPTVPSSSTPTFITSGVSLEWNILIEFVTPRINGDSEGTYAELLEELSRDERGVVLAATEAIDCESFEIAVPIRIYGALGGNLEKDDSVDGLPV